MPGFIFFVVRILFETWVLCVFPSGRKENRKFIKVCHLNFE